MQKRIKTFIILGIVAVLIIVIIGAILIMKQTKATQVILETNYGNITFELREDMPITAGNFKSLVEKGTYDNTISHRIIDKFKVKNFETIKNINN
jgi:peptidylprolyl isomerase